MGNINVWGTYSDLNKIDIHEKKDKAVCNISETRLIRNANLVSLEHIFRGCSLAHLISRN